MIIDLTDVSINYSASLPEVRLEIPIIELITNTNTANIKYIHSLPMHVPNAITGVPDTTYTIIDQGTIQMPIPQALTDVLTAIMQQYIAGNYGNA